MISPELSNKCHFSGGSLSDKLKHVELPIVNNDECQENYKKYTRLANQSFVLHKSFVCAGGKRGEDTCHGDGGGPLMCPSIDDPNKWIQVNANSCISS